MRVGFSFAVVAACLWSSPVFAHHAMGGRLPSTFSEGLWSGLAHPVIGPDHFLAVVAIGLLSAGFARGAWFAGIFVVAGLLGTELHLLRIDIPAVEVVVAATVVLLGLLILAKRKPPGGAGAFGLLAPTALLAGVFHGYAYGESIVGAEHAALGAYLLGFSLVQIALIFLVRRIGTIVRSRFADARVYALAGGGVSVAGVALVLIALRG